MYVHTSKVHYKLKLAESFLLSYEVLFFWNKVEYIFFCKTFIIQAKVNSKSMRNRIYVTNLNYSDPLARKYAISK